ncbi:MAG: ABC transporter permease [Candidatus Flexifilum sp.]|jgi:thiamine transport system permease protein
MDRDRFTFRRLIGSALLLMPIGFILIFFYYPLASILTVSIAPAGRIDWSGLTAIVTRSYLRDTIAFTLMQAVLSTAITLGLALPASYIFAHYRFPGRQFILSLSALPFVLPTVVVAAALLAVLGERGLINEILRQGFGLTEPWLRLERSLALIIVAHVYFNFSIAFRLITGFWMVQSPRIEEAAQVLGANALQLWLHIRFPLLKPAITSAALLIFIFNFTSFGVVLLLGGGRFSTIEVEIYTQTISLFNLPVAAALALIQLAVMGLMMLIYARSQARQPAIDLRSQASLRHPTSRREWGMIVGAELLIGLAIVLPLLGLIGRSIGPEGDFTRYWRTLGAVEARSVLFVPPVQAIGNSIQFAAASLMLSVPIGTLAAYSVVSRRRVGRLFDLLLMLPLATSAVTLGLGFIITFDEPPLNLRTSPWLIPIAHTLIALPFVVRSVIPALRAISPSMREAAAVLGASPRQILALIDVPLISRGIIVGGVFAFAISLGEFGASLFIARPNMPTLPIVIQRLLGQPGADNYGQAMALSVILTLVCALAIFAMEKLRLPGSGTL